MLPLILAIYLLGVVAIVYRNRLWGLSQAYTELTVAHQTRGRDLERSQYRAQSLSRTLYALEAPFEGIRRSLEPGYDAGVTARGSDRGPVNRFRVMLYMREAVAHEMDLESCVRFMREPVFRGYITQQLAEGWKMAAISELHRAFDALAQDPSEMVKITPVTSSGYNDFFKRR